MDPAAEVAVAHPALEEQRPVPIDVTGVGASLRELGSHFAGAGVVLVEPAELRLQHAEAQHSGLVELEHVADRCRDRVNAILAVDRHRLEEVAVVAQRLGHDREQAMRLRHEVVVERRLADPDHTRHLGPLGAVVAVLGELMGGGDDDRIALGA